MDPVEIITSPDGNQRAYNCIGISALDECLGLFHPERCLYCTRGLVSNKDLWVQSDVLWQESMSDHKKSLNNMAASLESFDPDCYCDDCADYEDCGYSRRAKEEDSDDDDDENDQCASESDCDDDEEPVEYTGTNVEWISYN